MAALGENIDISMINEKWQEAVGSFNFKKVNDKINACQNPIYPEVGNIFNCLNSLNPEDVKVVILGQDPYHGPGQATGYCFAFQGEKIPPSLKNIKKELLSDIGSNLIDFSLKKWTDQGVLLLNSSLTVEQGKANSHAKEWKGFAELIIEYLNKNYKKIVFVAWGAHAYDKLININDDNHLIVSSHPSPLSATKAFKEFGPFIGSKPFSKINAYLGKGKEIDF